MEEGLIYALLLELYRRGDGFERVIKGSIDQSHNLTHSGTWQSIRQPHNLTAQSGM